MFFGRRQKFQLNNAETTYKVHYLGNVMTSLVKGGYHHGNSTSSITSLISKKSTQFNSNSTCGFDEKESRFFNISEPQIVKTLSSNEERHEQQPHHADNLIMEATLNKKFSNIICNVDKPVKILWDNHLKHNGHAGLKMKLTLTQGGLRVNTKDHGLTEYYGHRIHFITAHQMHPKLFVWVYQHVGKNLKSEIRCHAVLCERARDARLIEKLLTIRLHTTFMEYKREKRRQQNSRLCNSKNGGLLTGQLGTRKRSFTKSTKNYKPPVQHGMCSAPKLDDVIEEEEEDEYCDTEIENNHSNAADNTTIDSEAGTTVYDNLEELENFGQDEDDFEDFDKDLYSNPNDESCLKLPLSSSSSSSLTSEPGMECKLNSGSPIFISSCSAASSISSSSTNNSSENHSISPNSETPSTKTGPATASPHLKVLANDSGVCTSTSSVLSTEHLNKFNQVSYEFFDDLSKPQIKPILVNNNHTNNPNNRFRTRSFNTKVMTGVAATAANLNFNPFSRGTISRSFSAFTTRLKQQQQQQNKSASVDKYVQKTLTFNDLVVEIEAKTDALSLNEEVEVPQVHKKRIAPLLPPASTSGAITTPTSFIKCYKNTNEFFYLNNINGGVNKKKPVVTRVKRDSSHCSNSPLSSPELSSSSDISTYSTHSQSSPKNTQTIHEIDDAQYIISL